MHGKWKVYKILVSSGFMSDMDKIPTVDEYENVMEGDKDLIKKS